MKKIIALCIFLFVFVIGGILGFHFLSRRSGVEENANQNTEVIKAEDNLVFIKGGTFQMGSPTNEKQRQEDERLHEVTINDLYVSPYEVTQKEYENLMENNPSEFKGEDLPVESITWYEAIQYCNKLSEENNLTPAYEIDGESVKWNRNANGYRLLTEAEWEYVARAGTNTPFNTENSISAEEANYYGHYPYGIEENYFEQENLETKPGEYRQTTIKIGSFQANNWGLYDIHGNVREWVYDYYGEYDLAEKNNPTGPDSGALKVTRGGGWNDYAKHMRSAFRSSLSPSQKMNNTGFRIARNGDNAINSTVVENHTDVKKATGKKLIVYFSWSGNTEGVARMIQEKIDADIFEIQLEKPYSSNYNTVLDQAQRDLNNNARPKIKGKVENIEDYQVVMLGYPNWWATIPMPIASFLDDYNLDGKYILPFCSHGGGSFGQSITDIAKIESKAIIGEGLSVHYSGGNSLSSDIDAWLTKNGISE